MSNRWFAYGLCAGIFLMSMLYRSSAAVIAPQLSRDLGLTPSDLGLLGAVFFYSFALAQFPLGFLLDRAGSKKTVVFLNLAGAAGAIIFSAAHGLAGGLIGRAVLGLGMSANLMGILKLFSRWFRPTEFATASGLLVSVGSLGSLLATSPLVLLVELTGWRGAFIVLAVFNLILVALFSLAVREEEPSTETATEASAEPNSALGVTRRLLTDKSFWAIAGAAGLRYGAFAAVQTLWAGPFFIIHLGLSPLVAGNLLLILTLGQVCGAPSGGYLSDRIFRSRKKTGILGLVCAAIFVFILSRWPGADYLPLLGGLMFFMGFFGAFGQVFYAHIKELMPKDMTGTAMTGINFFVFMGAGVFLHGFGGILDRKAEAGLSGGEAYATAFLLCSLAIGLAALSLKLSRDSVSERV